MHRVVVIFVYSLLALTGLFGNIWVISTVVGQFLAGVRQRVRYHHRHQSSMQTSAYLYLLLLSIADLISIGAIPLLDVDIASSQWPFGSLACRLLFTFEGANKSLTPLVLMALSVDRYVAVCRSSHHRLREWRSAIGISACCIGISLLFILPVALEASVTSLWDSNEREHVKCTVVMTPVYDSLHTIACFVVPLSVICGVYVAILRKLYRHMGKMKRVSCESRIPISRVVVSSVMVVAFYFVCWTPYWAHRIANMATSRGDQPLAIHREELEITQSQSMSMAEHISRLEHLLHQSGPDNFTSMLEGMNIFQLIQLHDELVLEEKTTPLATPSHPAQQHLAVHQQRSYMIHMLEMYLLHALPYCQCAFNWLFYSFLNRNLRQHHHSRHPHLSRTHRMSRPSRTAYPSPVGNSGDVNTALARRKSEPALVADHDEPGRDQLSPSPTNTLMSRNGRRRMSRSTNNLCLPKSITATTTITEVASIFEPSLLCFPDPRHSRHPPWMASPTAALLLPAVVVET